MFYHKLNGGLDATHPKDSSRTAVTKTSTTTTQGQGKERRRQTVLQKLS